MSSDHHKKRYKGLRWEGAWHRAAVAEVKARGDTVWSYGSVPEISKPPVEVTLPPLRAWMQGIDGHVHWRRNAVQDINLLHAARAAREADWWTPRLNQRFSERLEPDAWTRVRQLALEAQ